VPHAPTNPPPRARANLGTIDQADLGVNVRENTRAKVRENMQADSWADSRAYVQAKPEVNFQADYKTNARRKPGASQANVGETMGSSELYSGGEALG